MMARTQHIGRVKSVSLKYRQSSASEINCEQGMSVIKTNKDISVGLLGEIRAQNVARAWIQCRGVESIRR